MLAIVIPYYKITFFQATLESLANQTNKQFTVYIGDDASPEFPSILLQKYKKQFNFEYHRFTTNLGGTTLTEQWERCIENTKNEEWLMILGDDDMLSHNLVASFYENLENGINQEISVVRFATKIINEKGEQLSEIFKHPIIETSVDFLTRKFSKKTRSSISEYIFRKKVVQQKLFRNLPLAWHADDMAILEFSDFKNCYSINDATVSVRVSNTSITGDTNLNNIKNKATFEFCGVLFNEYSEKFSLVQRKIILKKLEIAFLNICSWKNYCKISTYYYGQLGLKEVIHFQFKLIKIGIIWILKKVKLFPIVKNLHFEIYKK